MDRFADQVVVVTGGGKGIGRAIARRFAAEGAKVAICGRDGAALTTLANELDPTGARVQATALDVADSAALVTFIEGAANRFGRLDVLVNNASLTGMSGIGFQTVSTMDPAEWHRVIDVNLSAAFHASQVAAKLMKSARSGSIISISSVHAHIPNATTPHYDAAKAAIEALTKASALALGRFGVRVNAIAPGPIAVWEESAEPDGYAPEERAAQRNATALKRFGTSTEIANVAAFLASSEASYITGATIVVDGGFLLRHPGMSEGAEED